MCICVYNVKKFFLTITHYNIFKIPVLSSTLSSNKRDLRFRFSVTCKKVGDTPAFSKREAQ